MFRILIVTLGMTASVGGVCLGEPAPGVTSRPARKIESGTPLIITPPARPLMVAPLGSLKLDGTALVNRVILPGLDVQLTYRDGMIVTRGLDHMEIRYPDGNNLAKYMFNSIRSPEPVIPPELDSWVKEHCDNLFVIVRRLVQDDPESLKNLADKESQLSTADKIALRTRCIEFLVTNR